MRWKRTSKKMKRFLDEKEILLDCVDEYQEEILELRKNKGDRAQRAALNNKVANRCKKESHALFRMLSWGVKGYRGLFLGAHCLTALTVLLVMGAVGGAVLTGRRGQWLYALPLALIAVVLVRLSQKIYGLLCDMLVWNLMKKDYHPENVVWTQQQTMLLPERLRPYVVPLRSSLEPENCIRSKLRCTCGGQSFRVLRHRQNGYLEAVCCECKQEIVLFDEHLDAHDADGQAQSYPWNALEMAACYSCVTMELQVVITVVSDTNRSFFQRGEITSTMESGYGLIYQMFCAYCGELRGDGSYFWSNDWEKKKEEETEREAVDGTSGKR